MNLQKETCEKIEIKKRKTLKIDKQGDFFILSLSNHKLDNKDRSSELIQMVEIVLTEKEANDLKLYLIQEINDIPF